MCLINQYDSQVGINALMKISTYQIVRLFLKGFLALHNRSQLYIIIYEHTKFGYIHSNVSQLICARLYH